jgi:hypothetical protein
MTLEKAKTDRVCCRNCGKKILKDELKGISSDRGFGGYDVKISYCVACIRTIILNRIKELNEMIELIDKK